MPYNAENAGTVEIDYCVPSGIGQNETAGQAAAMYICQARAAALGHMPISSRQISASPAKREIKQASVTELAKSE